MNPICTLACITIRLQTAAALFSVFLLSSFSVSTVAAGVPTPMTDTGQTACFNNYGTMTCPGEGRRFFGQDANYAATPMA